MPVGLATPDELVEHGAVTVTVQVLVTVGQVLSGAAEDDVDGITGAALVLLLGVAEDEDMTGEAEEEAVTGQTVVETATTEVTTMVSVMLSGCSGQFVTEEWHEVMVLVWVL